MSMIKCVECGKDISDKAVVCIGCGASITVSTRVGSSDGDGKGDFDDFKTVWKKLTDKTSSAVKGAGENIKGTFMSDEQKDDEDLNKLTHKFNEHSATDKTDSQINCDKFKAALESTIDIKFAEVISVKPGPEKFLTYIDAQILAASVRNIFKTVLTFTPPQVEFACNLSEAILAPSSQKKKNMFKAAIGFIGGTVGIGMVIGGVYRILGWNENILEKTAHKLGLHSHQGAVALIIAGISVAAIAGYFAMTSNKETDTERFLKVFKSATAKAVDAIWEQHGADLTKAAG